jgi:hypothetical protein
MKKNYLFLLSFLCLGLFSAAQPIITSADFTNYSAIGHDVPNFTGISLGNAGANQTWDYAWLVPATTNAPDIYVATVPVTAAPYYFAFPLANYCQKISYTYNSILFETYSFSKITVAGIESVGSTNSAGISSQFSDTQMTPLPLQYGDTYIDTYQTTTASNSTSTNNTYDAYGTLTTPYGTVTNVIRLKQVGSGSTTYNWIKTSSYVPLMAIRVDNTSGNVTSVTIYQNTTNLAVNQISVANKIMTYPNPATNYINLQLPNNIAVDKIVITDLLGKTILEETKTIAAVNVENLNSGLYILQVYGNGQKLETKFVKR